MVMTRREAFDAEGFFLTGDTVQLGGSPPLWRIVGRTSVDIIKYNGYKVNRARGRRRRRINQCPEFMSWWWLSGAVHPPRGADIGARHREQAAPAPRHPGVRRARRPR